MDKYNTKEIFSTNLKRILSNRNVTQAELAETMGVAYSSVSAWCTGEKMPRMDKVEWIANHFGIRKSDLLEESESAYAPSEPTVQYAGPVAAHFDATPTEQHEYMDVPQEWLGHRKPEDFFIAEVDGNSMYPHYQHGDRILCLRCSDMGHSGRVGIILTGNGEATLKRIEYQAGENWIDLIPLNPEYAPKRIEGADLEQCRIVGRVVKVFRDVDEI